MGDENRPTTKSGQRKEKAEHAGKMAGTRGKKSARWQNPQSDQSLEATETTSVPDTWTENTAIDEGSEKIPKPREFSNNLFR